MMGEAAYSSGPIGPIAGVRVPSDLLSHGRTGTPWFLWADYGLKIQIFTTDLEFLYFVDVSAPGSPDLKENDTKSKTTIEFIA